jgi:threonylcarbamoyladenosine tRNA methylthiotransferase MtaB
VERALLPAAFDFVFVRVARAPPPAFCHSAHSLSYHTYVSAYYVENFGCRATQADGAALERQFQERGLARAATSAQASIVILNTCTVTAAADQDARAAIRRVHRQNPDSKIVVTGCYAQRAPTEIAALPGVSLVVGNSHKHELADIVANHASSGASVPDFAWRSALSAAKNDTFSEGASVPKESAFVPLATLTESRVFVSDIFAHTELLAAPVFDASNERTRPNLKVQDGCDNRCSFCVIPHVRGQSRSLAMARIIHDINALVESGYCEVVISGINLGRWGRDLHVAQKPSLEDLIRSILSQTALEKLRISSVEPMDWSDELISLVASSSRIARHAHVPLQSGSDAVLRRMHRKYRPWHYREKIHKIRAAMPSAAIGADVMVGFPGETDAEFESTHRLVEDLPFTYLHVFTYSARPGTPAAAMTNHVPTHLARERNRILRELAAEKKLQFMRGFVGRTLQAITLHGNAGEGTSEFTEALTDNYLKMRLKGRHQPNRWMQARVEDVIDGVLIGDTPGSYQPTPSGIA